MSILFGILWLDMAIKNIENKFYALNLSNKTGSYRKEWSFCVGVVKYCLDFKAETALL